MRWPGRRAALAFIFVTVLLDMLALGLIAPVLAPLVVSFLGGDTARAAEIYGLAFTLFALMQFFASPVLGALSDRFGRRPVVLLSNLGLGLDYVLRWGPRHGPHAPQRSDRPGKPGTLLDSAIRGPSVTG